MGGAFEVLLLAIAGDSGDEVEKWENAGAFGIPWQKKRWSSLTSSTSFYNDAVRRSFLNNFKVALDVRDALPGLRLSGVQSRLLDAETVRLAREVCLMSLKV